MSEKKTVLRAAAPRDPLLGTTLGAFRVLEQFGQGGMSQLYRAEEIATGKKVAIKVLSEGSDDPVGARRMIEEARAVVAVKHPGIIELFGLGQVPDGRPYLAMELLEGQSLFEVMQKHGGKLSVAQTLTVLDQVLAGLVAAHAAGIVHRDLKPENIFVHERPDGWRLKILDFGLALRTDDDGAESSRLTALGSVVGTPQFMAPEQANGEGPMTDRTDVYALGAVAFAMLTGRELFSPGTLAQIMVRQIEEPAPPLRPLVPEVPEALEALVLQMLEKEQAQRPTAAGARARIVALRSGPARTASTPRQPAVRGRRRAPIIAGVAAVLLALGIGGVWVKRVRGGAQVVLPVVGEPAAEVAPVPNALAKTEPKPEPEPEAKPGPPPEVDTSQSWRCAQIKTVGKVIPQAGGTEAAFEVRFVRGAPLLVVGSVEGGNRSKAIDSVDRVREGVLRCKIFKKKLSASATRDNGARVSVSDLKVEDRR